MTSRPSDLDRFRGPDTPTTAASSIGEATLLSVQFRVDQASGKMVLRVVDRLSGEILRQVPPEEALKIAAYIRSYLQGLAARDSSAPKESR